MARDPLKDLQQRLEDELGIPHEDAPPSGPVSREAHFQLLNAHSLYPAYQAAQTYEEREDFFDGLIGKRWQVTEEVYDYSLEVMPPIYVRGGFLVREALFGDIYSMFTTGPNKTFWHTYVAYPPRKSVAELQKITQKADEAFQAALVETFGREAGDVRYLAARQPPEVRKLGARYVEAVEYRYGPRAAAADARAEAMTEEEAKTKACCAGAIPPAKNSACVGSACMAWRISRAACAKGDTRILTTIAGGVRIETVQEDQSAEGYCGLAGPP